MSSSTKPIQVMQPVSRRSSGVLCRSPGDGVPGQNSNLHVGMSCSKGGYIGDYIGDDYSRVFVSLTKMD